MDGWVIIGTKLDSSQLDKELKEQQRRLAQFEKEAEQLTKSKAKVELDLESYYEAEKQIKAMTDGMLQYSQTEAEVNDALKVEERQLAELNEKYSEQFKTLEEINQKIKENTKNQSLMKTQVEETTSKLAKASILQDIGKSTDNIGSKLSGIVNNVARWGLAVFGIRSAYMAVRRAISLVSSSNEEVATKLEVMQNILANALAPIVKYIVNLMAKLMVYANYIFKALTGKQLFDFSKMTSSASKNLASGAKSAKEINKQLASFDEMNVLSDTSSASSGGSGGVSGPSIDKDMFDIKIPEKVQKWLDKIVWFGRWVIDNWPLVVDLLLGIKLFIDVLTGNWIGVVIDLILILINHWGDFKELGETIAKAWKAYWKWVGDAIQKLIQWFIDLNVKFAIWITKIANKIIEFFAKIGIWALETWDKIKAWVSTIAQWIYDHIIKPVLDFFAGLWDGIKNGVKTAVEWVKDKFKSIVDFFSNLISKIVGLFKTIGTKVGDAIGGAFKAVINGVLRAIENILNFPIKSINKLIKVINKVPGIDLGTLPTFSLPRLAKGGIVNMPGAGVPVGSAIAGERGQEGVIPLTDSQQMQLLGEAIGRYITINASITNTMNGRVISRELQKIQGESDFAFNR